MEDKIRVRLREAEVKLEQLRTKLQFRVVDRAKTTPASEIRADTEQLLKLRGQVEVLEWVLREAGCKVEP